MNTTPQPTEILTVAKMMKVRDFRLHDAKTYRHTHHDGSYVHITDFTGNIPADCDSPCTVYLYDKEGDCLNIWQDLPNLPYALHVARWDVTEFLYQREG